MLTVGQRVRLGLARHVAVAGVQTLAGQCRNQLRTEEAGCSRSSFAQTEKGLTEASPRPAWVYEKGANFRGFGSGVERPRVSGPVAVSAKGGRAMAPAPYGD